VEVSKEQRNSDCQEKMKNNHLQNGVWKEVVV
jgi:hypothetical protein